MMFRNFLNFVISFVVIISVTVLTPGLYDIFVKFSVIIVGMKLAEWLMTCTRKYFLYKTVNPRNKAVLITGCDTGFGNKLARRMDALGYKVYAACLNPTGPGAKELLYSCTQKLCVIPMDVTKDQSVKDAKEYVKKSLENNVLWAIVNNAGIGHAGEVDWTPFEEFQRVHDVNAAGALRVTKAFLPLVKQAKGRIVNNNSICGHFTCPGFIGYCMSKSAAVALTTGLRVELAKWGVKAISIEPFFYATPLTQTNTVCDMAEKTWQEAPLEVREEYGEQYKDAFKRNTALLLGRCSSKINDVIDCFEDAITAEEPLSTYFPSRLQDKVGIKLSFALPSVIQETYQRYFLERGAKPSALKHGKN